MALQILDNLCHKIEHHQTNQFHMLYQEEQLQHGRFILIWYAINLYFQEEEDNKVWLQSVQWLKDKTDLNGDPYKENSY